MIHPYLMLLATNLFSNLFDEASLTNSNEIIRFSGRTITSCNMGKYNMQSYFELLY